MNCDLHHKGDKWVCSVCGRALPVKAVARCGRSATMPSITRMAWNLATSLAAFVSDGCALVSAEEYAARLTICDTCEFRRGNRCLKCGCRLALKAKGRAFKCPEGKWPTSE